MNRRSISYDKLGLQEMPDNLATNGDSSSSHRGASSSGGSSSHHSASSGGASAASLNVNDGAVYVNAIRPTSKAAGAPLTPPTADGHAAGAVFTVDVAAKEVPYASKHNTPEPTMLQHFIRPAAGTPNLFYTSENAGSWR